MPCDPPSSSQIKLIANNSFAFRDEHSESSSGREPNGKTHKPLVAVEKQRKKAQARVVAETTPDFKDQARSTIKPRGAPNSNSSVAKSESIKDEIKEDMREALQAKIQTPKRQLVHSTDDTNSSSNDLHPSLNSDTTNKRDNRSTLNGATTTNSNRPSAKPSKKKQEASASYIFDIAEARESTNCCCCCIS
jgi:hypothetical protein